MIKLFTTKKHRFGSRLIIKNQEVIVNNLGEIEVDETFVTSAMEVGFELVDKDAKFTSVEEANKVKEVNEILISAKKQADEIISEAKREAELIIMEAKTAANAVIFNTGTEEKNEFLKTLQDRKVDELREVAVSSDMYTSEEVNKMKKTDLIEAIMKIRYPS